MVAAPLLAALMLGAGPAGAQEPADDLCHDRASQRGARFQARAEGSPIATVIGGWRVGGRMADFCFRGGHVLGSGTTIALSWTSPYSRASVAPSFDAGFSFPAINPLAEIRLTISVRSQPKGQRWERWRHWSPGLGTFGGSGAMGNGYFFPTPQRVRWQWRLTIEIIAPTVLSGDGELRVS